LQQQINELKGNNATFRSSENETGTTGIVNPVISQSKLSQNAPNPFTNQTEIKYFVETGVKNAYICIFDMQGKMLQKINAATGQNSIMIQGSTLQAGIYLYSLVADGQEVDTKRMILTK
jgi:myo-inositol-hexaphosphate 3-phosphohydrolase